MLFSDPAKTYPHLVQVLNTLSRRSFGHSPWREWRTWIGLEGVTFAAVGMATLSPIFLGLGVVGLAVSGVLWNVERRKGPPPPRPRAEAATAVARSMSQMLAKRRLHRDVDATSLELLEECARHWARCQAALDAPFWTSGNVPENHRRVRQLALDALEDSMDDVLLQYQSFVPATVANRAASDYVEEALENIAGRRRRKVDFPPPALGPVREIAERLRSLGDETERLAQEVRVTLNPREAVPVTAALDETLAELRAIRQAEDEVRQSTGS